MADGSYEGPTLSFAAQPFDLEAVIAALAAQFSDFHFSVTRISPSASIAHVEWTLSGTNDGAIKRGVPATGKRIHLNGIDVLEIAQGKIAKSRRFYDRRTMLEQLGLQVLVEPHQLGAARFGYSLHASSGNPAPPGIVALTWIEGRDEAERDRIREHSGAIVADFLNEPGFIGIVTGFAGDHGFTCTAWQDEDALHRALDQHHAKAKQDFRTSGLSPAVWTSVWRPDHLNRLWLRCPQCEQPNDMTANPSACSKCGRDLPARPPYW